MIRDDLIATTKSISDKNISLTLKLWFHIIESPDYMSGNTDKILKPVNSPDYVVKGLKEELIALKHYLKTKLREKYCVLIYKENEEGFIIIAFFTSKCENPITRCDMAKITDFDSSVIPYLLKFNQKSYWVDYDDETDTLSISFRKPQCADDSVMEDNFIFHYDKEKLVGET